MRKSHYLIIASILAVAVSMAVSACGRKTTDSQETDLKGSETAAESTPHYEKPSNPEKVLSAEEYFDQNSTVITVENANEADNVLSEREVIAFLHERGFSEYPIVYSATIEGIYVGDTACSENSSEKHPLYQTYYVSGEQLIWSIYVINDTIIASPVSYNIMSDSKAEILFSESDHLTSYDNELNRFYVTVPNEKVVVLKTVETINTDGLDRLTLEEIGK